ncbi:hypothetical protein [Pedobacter montanisoli]|uniref:Type II secretion system protein n=1 Tax=Pedobacter montanisoli TaxID=2923277 RepID=A0ABS9ZZE1_9SPHI|nr:hypothetical protein [Pedobacter montanisoli]MCJ0743683.1 hypothetical protein [Pedobacter montanisoli]
MRKIKAYTILEVTVTMFLSAICITICYTVYSIMGNYYEKFQQKNQKADALTSLKHVMTRDAFKSRLMLRTQDGITLEKEDHTSIAYQFVANAVLRKLNEQHTDTFKLICENWSAYFEGKDVRDEKPIDRLYFEVRLDPYILVPVQINKDYSSEDLFK